MNPAKTLQKSLILFILLITFIFQVQGRQDPRRLEAMRVAHPPKMDGTLSDPIWQLAFPANGFMQYEPHNDRPASFETEVRVLFDDNSIYIGALLFDPSPDSILTELGLRDADDKLNADQFWVDINPFNDGVNGFRFKVSASGVETDVNMSGSTGNRGDLNWDAVWKSQVSITDFGWVVEMEIPYSALRFPKGAMQDWGINFWREIRRTRESSSWNFVNRRIGEQLGSMGLLSGLDGIDPPLRLAFFPYVSGYMEKNGGDLGWARTFNGGMDVKYGISESFTLDMTLIPDFGQVHSDARVLNLTPYEVKYDENRQFFTEGTELFSKADLFYSRRIGTEPKGYRSVRNELLENEVIEENPVETRLINATKFSGRTSRGLGIGIFNGMTAASNALVLDTIGQQTREITTQPFTNYNLVVLDQSLPNNSYVSLVNTNVSGSAEGYMANVTGTEFRLLDRTNMFRASGKAALSQQYFSEADNNFGYKYDLNLGKYGGTWQYSYSRSVISDTYEQNDMGFLRRNNEVEDEVSLSYNVFDPFWRILNYSTGLSFEYSKLFNPRTFTGMELGYNLRVLFDTRFFIIFRANYKPQGERDYFEPRAPGRFYETDDAFDLYLMYSTDYRKRVYLDGSFYYEKINSIYNQDSFNFDFRPTFRASDRLNIGYGLNYSEKRNDIGYVRQNNPEEVYFGKRNSPTTINTLRTTYIFSPTIALNFDLRHYWSRVFYDGDYFFLNTNGRLENIEEDLQIPDINYNAFTIDMKLTWNFAPGSQLSLVWKNIIDSRQSDASPTFLENLERTLNEPQLNSFSLKLLYYIDYQMIRRAVSR
ncbi:MAG: carbohydrate binding family 9 domain-containing protein [Bacteroidales bacterium]|nr:carbohydrate binding family 9 domain-containing protein [Bacteroidales bacterium]